MTPPVWLNRHWLIDAVLQGPAGRWHHSAGEGRCDQAAAPDDEDPQLMKSLWFPKAECITELYLKRTLYRYLLINIFSETLFIKNVCMYFFFNF